MVVLNLGTAEIRAVMAVRVRVRGRKSKGKGHGHGERITVKQEAGEDIDQLVQVQKPRAKLRVQEAATQKRREKPAARVTPAREVPLADRIEVKRKSVKTSRTGSNDRQRNRANGVDPFERMIRHQLGVIGYTEITNPQMKRFLSLSTPNKINAMRGLGFTDERIMSLFNSTGVKVTELSMKKADQMQKQKQNQKDSSDTGFGKRKEKSTNGVKNNTQSIEGTPSTIVDTPRNGLEIPLMSPGLAITNRNKLVISTSTKPDNGNLLTIYNLTLGLDQEKLKDILESYGNTEIDKVVVRDLPTGSAMATVHLKEPSTEELIRVRDFFHGATVDGRTIQVMISADPTKNLSSAI